MSQTFDNRAALQSMVIPAYVTSIVGGVWLALADTALKEARVVMLMLLALIAIGTLAFFIASIRFAREVRRVATGMSPLRDRRKRLIYIGAVMFEAVAYIIGYNVLSAYHRLDFVIPLLAFVVGLHFFGLIPVFQTNRFILAASVFCLAAIVALFLPSAVPIASYTVNVRILFVGLVCGLYMWYVASRLLTQGRHWVQEANTKPSVEATVQG